MVINFYLDTNEVKKKIRRWWHFLWRKYPYTYLPFFINKCYEYYYTKKHGPIMWAKDRYALQPFLFSNDREAVLLAIPALLEYSAGSDLIRDCSYRITWSSDWDCKHHPEKVTYYKIGNLQLNYNSTVQEVLDCMRKDYQALLDIEADCDTCLRCLESYIIVIRYWMLYHARIGSNCCPCCMKDGYVYPNPTSYDHREPEKSHFGTISQDWDWRHRTARWKKEYDSYRKQIRRYG